MRSQIQCLAELDTLLTSHAVMAEQGPAATDRGPSRRVFIYRALERFELGLSLPGARLSGTGELITAESYSYFIIIEALGKLKAVIF